MARKINAIELQCDKPHALHKRIVLLLAHRPVLEIHKETGLPFHWLEKMKQNKIKNPSVNRTIYLYERLSGRKVLL